MISVDLLAGGLDALRQRALEPVEVAVIDTGIDASHPDLRGRVVESFQILREGDLPRAVVSPRGACNDALGHGTGVASVIAEVAPNARLVDIRVVDSGCEGADEALLAALRLCNLRRFRVLNLSLACHGRHRAALTEICEQAFWQDQVVVAAQRNMPLLEHGVPAELSSVIGVDAGSFPSPFAFRFRPRSPIELVARGEGVRVASPGGGYSVQTGTSYATPVVSGLCALLLGARPELSPFEVRTVLKALAERG